MVKLIIASPYDFNAYMSPGSQMFKSMSNIFFTFNAKQYMYERGVETVNLLQFLDDEYPYKFSQMNDVENPIDRNEESKERASEFFYKAISNLMKAIETTNEYNNSTIFAIQPMGFDPFLSNAGNNILKSKNIKLIAYMDDLHAFSCVRKGASLEDILLMDVPKLQFKDNRIEYSHCFLSMSRYFYHINTYANKIIYYYAPFDDITFAMFSTADFYSRKSQILLSGAIGGYPLRVEIKYAIDNDSSHHHLVAKKYYDIISHACSCYDKDRVKDSGFLGYYNKFNKYQGAFSGYYSYPLNHVLWKTFEILASGTILFSEKNPILSQIGLISDYHYVEVDRENLFNQNFLDSYLGTEKGKNICENGYQFMRNFNHSKKCLDFFLELINGDNIDNIDYCQMYSVEK